jgi:uncharacterized protein
MTFMPETDFRRTVFETALAHLSERRRFIQVLAGPRQVGKTTLAHQLGEAIPSPSLYGSADEAPGFDRAWIEQRWSAARALAAENHGAVLILDEVQKIQGWSDVVKRHWDEDTRKKVPLKVVILGSAPLLVKRGLSESLAGRFELIRVTHWSFAEMRDAFGFDLDRYVYFGGYPGAAALVGDEERWRRYILDSLVETTLARDVLLLNPVTKPALLRQLFRLGCEYSGQILAFNKMLGQLHDAGNTTTLAHYLELLSGAGMISGLPKHSGSAVRARASIPKLLVQNTALMSAVLGVPFREAREDPDVWGRLVESSAGAHLVNSGVATGYWRDRNREADFVVTSGRSVLAIEVTSGRRKGSLPGLAAFIDRYPGATPLLVGAEGVPLDEFLISSPKRWMPTTDAK